MHGNFRPPRLPLLSKSLTRQNFATQNYLVGMIFAIKYSYCKRIKLSKDLTGHIIFCMGYMFLFYHSHSFLVIGSVYRIKREQTLTLFPKGGSPPKTGIANYNVFSPANMLFYYLTFRLTELPNFWQKKNLKFFGGNPPFGPLKNNLI